jgi:hypothetical protein
MVLRERDITTVLKEGARGGGRGERDFDKEKGGEGGKGGTQK